MLPPPSLSFTIPSVHDALSLKCRVYHPKCLAPTAISHITQWNKKAAIVAHPYAPLGGCMDDPIVGIIATLLLKQGFVVGTFNFRGASDGRTSWQAKAEQNDYKSFIGFMVYYVHRLSPPPLPFDFPKFTSSEPELHDLTPIQSQAILSPHTPSSRTASSSLSAANFRVSNSQPRLLLAGYSYGALITASLPAIISSILSPFQTPLPGSAHAEIRMRAEFLACQQNEIMATQMPALLFTHHRGRSTHTRDGLQSPKVRPSMAGIRMGGDEDMRRGSHDSHRSRSSFALDAPEIVRKSVDRVRSIRRTKGWSPKKVSRKGSYASSHRSGAYGSQSSIDPTEKAQEWNTMRAIPGIGEGMQMAYLLVSPLHGLVSSLATMWSRSRSWKEKDAIPENEMKLTVDPTLAIFGDEDVFVSVKRLRTWAERLRDAGKGGKSSSFEHVVVPGAGHFWHDHQAIRTLQDEVTAFVKGL